MKRRGSALTEFALWVPIMLLMISGMIDLSWFLHQYHQVLRSAVDGATVGGKIDEDGLCLGDLAEPAAQAWAEQILTSTEIDCPDNDCVTVRAHDDLGYNAVTVTVQVPFAHLLGLFEFGTTINAEFTSSCDGQTADPGC